MQQLDMAAVMLKVGDVLRQDDAIKAFCYTNRAETLKVQVGEVLPDEQPGENDAPYVVILSGKKSEGANLSACSYSMSLVVGINSASRDRFETTDGSVMHDGYQLLNQFMTLIQKTLDDYRQIAQVETEVIGSASPDGTHWVGTMDVTWEIEQTIGFNQEF